MKRFFAAWIALLLILTLFPGTGLAAGDEYPFLVEVILPENNIDRLGYYHVPGTPGDILVLQAKLTNLTDEALEVYAIPLNAYSSPEGIVYQSAEDVDARTCALDDEAYGMAQYISTRQSYSIAPKSTVTANIRIEVPDIEAGTLLGSIRFRVYNGTQEVQSEDADGSTILIDEYLAVDTAIQIDLPGTVQPSVSAGVPSLTDAGLRIPVVNQAALITEDVSGTYEVRDSKDAVVLQGSAALRKMAPRTVWNLLEPWNSAWKEGEYTLTMRLTVNGQAADVTQPFTVGEAAISQMIESQQYEAAQHGAADPASASSDAVQDIVVKAAVIGIPAVFICVLLGLHIQRRKKKRLRQLRLLSEKRCVREA